MLHIKALTIHRLISGIYALLKYSFKLREEKKSRNDILFLARNEQLGMQAVQHIHASNKETEDKVHFHQLDVTNVESIRRFADHLKKTHGGLDILVNNAGIAFQVVRMIG